MQGFIECLIHGHGILHNTAFNQQTHFTSKEVACHPEVGVLTGCKNGLLKKLMRHLHGGHTLWGWDSFSRLYYTHRIRMCGVVLPIGRIQEKNGLNENDPTYHHSQKLIKIFLLPLASTVGSLVLEAWSQKEVSSYKGTQKESYLTISFSCLLYKWANDGPRMFILGCLFLHSWLRPISSKTTSTKLMFLHNFKKTTQIIRTLVI